MSKSVLVTYDTKSGSTADVARFIGETLGGLGAKVSVLSVADVQSLDSYDVVFIGSPIISGKCMKGVINFVADSGPSLREKKAAYFITCLRLSQAMGEPVPDIPIHIDPAFGDPKPKDEMSFPEKSHPMTTYLRSINDMAKGIEPISVSFFKGVLDYSKIGFFWTLFFKFTGRFDRLEPGDYRNWDVIRSWTEMTYAEI